jgi:hypothetical protein
MDFGFRIAGLVDEDRDGASRLSRDLDGPPL